MRLDRRILPRGIASLLGAMALATAAAAQPAPAGVLRVTPIVDLVTLDPTASPSTQTSIHGLMVYDTLYAQDSKLVPRPQMVGAETVSADGLAYRLTLRDGLRFHDGSPVTTRDVLASLQRWMRLDVVGRALAADLAEMRAEDDRTFDIVLRRTFPLHEALASSGGGLPVIMRAREAEGGPFTSATAVIGSGPFRFLRDQWIPGASFAYERFDGYVPREEPPDGFAGAKRVKVGRIEFKVLPDATTKANALQTGEIDIIDQVPFDQGDAILQARRPGIVVETLSSIYNPLFLRPNSLQPPFDNPKARQALALAIDQDDIMGAAFVRPEWGQPCRSFFVCGSGNDLGGEPHPDRVQNLARARQLLAESGYAGQRVVLLNSHEALFVGLAGDLVTDELRAIGLNVDVAESDWGTTLARRQNRGPVDKGGWSLFITSLSGSALYSPLSNPTTDTSCDGRNYAGWPCDEAASRLRDAYIHEADPARRRSLLQQLDARLWEVMPTVVLGQRASVYAWRSDVTGFVRSPSLSTIFWNVEKTGGRR